MKQLEKKGIKTTEFWVSTVIVPVFVPLIMVIVHKYGFPLSETAVTAVVVSAVTSPITYILGRIFNKKKIADIESNTVELKKLELEVKNAK